MTELEIMRKCEWHGAVILMLIEKESSAVQITILLKLAQLIAAQAPKELQMEVFALFDAICKGIADKYAKK